MSTLDDLAAVFADLIEVQAPAIDELPGGMDSVSWLASQSLVHGSGDVHGRFIGFKPEGMPGVLALSKTLRAANPDYVRGTQLRSFLNAVIATLVALKKSRADGPIQQQDLDQLEGSIAGWFSGAAISRQHLIPCAITPDKGSSFSIGPVRFVHIANFDPNEFGVSREAAEPYFGTLFASMQERAASWIAIVPLDGREAERSGEVADVTVDVALSAIQLVVPLGFSARTSRITARTSPPYKGSVVVTSDEISPGVTNMQPGRGLGKRAFDDMIAAASGLLSSAGTRISSYLTGGGRLPQLSLAWCDAAYWFHEAIAEPLDTVAVAKLETSIENLFGAGNLKESTARLLQAIKGIFGLSSADIVYPGSSVTVKDFAVSIVKARSRILHGTWSTLSDELPLGRGEVAKLAIAMLRAYTLMLDLYGKDPAAVDAAEPFLNFVEAQGSPPPFPTSDT